MADGGSGRALVDEIVPQGFTAERVAGAVQAHLDAGADHVCVQTLPPAGFKGVPSGGVDRAAGGNVALRPLASDRLNHLPNRPEREMSRGGVEVS